MIEVLSTSPCPGNVRVMMMMVVVVVKEGKEVV